MNSRFASLGTLCLMFSTCCLSISCFGEPLKAQQTSKIKPLATEDTMPDLVINWILRYRAASANRSDFRSKLLADILQLRPLPEV